jgi:hypothetical protein
VPARSFPARWAFGFDAAIVAPAERTFRPRQGCDEPAIWAEFGRVLEEAGKDVEAQFAYRMAGRLDASSA